MLTKNNQSNQLLKEAQKLGVLCKNCRNGIITKNNCFCLIINRGGMNPATDFCSLFERKEG